MASALNVSDTLADLATSDLTPRECALVAHALQPSPMLAKVEALRRACDLALHAAYRGELFESFEGMRLANAAYNLFECDQLSDVAEEIGGWIGLNRDGTAIRFMGDRS